MMCCENRNYGAKKVGDCPECGADVDEDGNALEQCAHSPIMCKTCGYAPCDGSC
jgi:hypothetical protein